MIRTPVRQMPRIEEIPDLQTQLESILDTVWWCERRWQHEDHIDRRVRYGKR